MNKDKIEGKVTRTVGTAKKKAGELLDDPALEAEGRDDEVAGRVQEGAREGGLAGAQVAVQVDRHAGQQGARQRSAQGGGTGFVVEMGFKVLHSLCRL